MIFTILTHCLNTTDTNNYFVRTQGRRFCLGAMLKGSSTLAHLDYYSWFPDGDNPRLSADAIPKTCYQPIFALDVATLRYGNMSLADAEGRDKLSAMGNIAR